MPIIGPILGVVARAVATKAAQRGAMAAAGRVAAGRTVSASQLGSRGLVGRLGQSAGRGAMLRTAFMASEQVVVAVVAVEWLYFSTN